MKLKNYEDDILKTLYNVSFNKLPPQSTTVFLIGPSLKNKEKNIREKVRKELSRKVSYFSGNEVYYPEYLFDELMQGRKKFNLLDLENMLANSVHAVVILLKSEGAIAELGAFANNKKLSKKLLVVVDKKYRNKKSFIILGPVRHIMEQDKRRVIFFDYEKGDPQELCDKLRWEIRFVARNQIIDKTINNPLALQNFIFILLFVAGPLSKEKLMDILKISQKYEADNEESLDSERENKLISTVIKILLKNKFVQIQKNEYLIEYLLTDFGKRKLLDIIGISKRAPRIMREINDQRVRVLNYERKEVKLFCD